MNNQNKTRYQIVISFFTILLLSSSLLAQPGQNRNHPPQLPDTKEIESMVDELAVEIQLSKEQKSEVSELFFTHFAEVKSLMKDQKENRENKRIAMANLKYDFETDVKALLTTEQKEGFDTFMAKRKSEPRQRPGRR